VAPPTPGALPSPWSPSAEANRRNVFPLRAPHPARSAHYRHGLPDAEATNPTAAAATPAASTNLGATRAIAPDGASRLPSPAIRPSALQPKLAIGPLNDPLERDADRVADQVMRMPQPHPHPSTTPTRLSRKCQSCEDEEEAKTLQPKLSVHASTPGSEAPAIVHEVLRCSGQPLDTVSQTFFQPRFGHDFAHIRIHTDPQAAQSARDVGALAYTAGNHIVFAAGQYAPTTSTGKALLAHELAHCVQQSAHSGTAPMLSRRVVAVNCPANQFGAPADPRTDLETADKLAIDYATKTAQALATDAQTVRGGIPDPPSATLRAFQKRFAMPSASGTGFLNRLTGDVRPSREIALSEELSVTSARYTRVATLISQGLSYTCPGKGRCRSPAASPVHAQQKLRRHARAIVWSCSASDSGANSTTPAAQSSSYTRPSTSPSAECRTESAASRTRPPADPAATSTSPAVITA
jgi:hypothetical protein